MDILHDVIKFLNSDPDIENAFGNMIQQVKIQDEPDLPFAVIQQVNTPQQTMMSGQGKRRYILQISIYDETINDIKTNGDLIENKLKGYRGTMGNGSVGFVFIRNDVIRWQSERRHYTRQLDVEISEG